MSYDVTFAWLQGFYKAGSHQGLLPGGGEARGHQKDLHHHPL